MRPKIPRPTSGQAEQAEIIALQVLAFLAADTERLQRFLDLTGLDDGALRRGASNPELLAAILDHLLSDESLLLIFAEEQALSPDAVARVRRHLPGANLDF
ncbi:DUF3572 domain-containing protein [Aestuariivirga sp.]|jgi:hypothetical protein|uniref:DUF3572 domain-containing protein n=1 Tax=Aestuariivirga sp. TaxID=2650926 RepID=UPI003783415C